MAQKSYTGFTPFKIWYQRDAILPIYINCNDKDYSSSVVNHIQHNYNENDNKWDIFDYKSFKIVFDQMIVIRNIIEDKVKKNIEKHEHVKDILILNVIIWIIYSR